MKNFDTQSVLSVKRHFRRRSLIFAASVAAAVTVGAGPALAAPLAPVPIPSNKCVGYDLCYYAADFFNGGAYETRLTDSRCKTFILGGMDNQATSIINRSTIQFYVYDNSTCSGTPMATIYARTANDNIGPANNDRISSWRTTGPLPVAP